MLIQDAVRKQLEENIDAGQYFYHAWAAGAFNDFEFPNMFVEDIHAAFHCRPETPEELLRLFAVIGFGAVVRYAKEHDLDAEFFAVK